MRSMSSPLTPARSMAAFTTVAPRSVADASASAPCIEPIGVRAIERMTVGSSGVVAIVAKLHSSFVLSEVEGDARTVVRAPFDYALTRCAQDDCAAHISRRLALFKPQC